MKIKQAKLYSKKSLCIFLAFVMLLMTGSVAFSIMASAYSVPSANDSVLDELAQALQSDTIAALVDTSDDSVTYTRQEMASDDKSATLTNSITTKSYEDYVAINEIINLVFVEMDYIIWYSYGSSSANDRGYAGNWASSQPKGENMYSLNMEMKSRLAKVISESNYAKYNISTVIDIIFDSWEGHQCISKDYGDYSKYFSTNPSASTLTFTLNVTTTDTVGYLIYEGAENYADMELQTTYKAYMREISGRVGIYTRYAYVFRSQDGYEYSGKGFYDYITTAQTTPAQKLIAAADAYKAAIEAAYAAYPTFENVYDFYKAESDTFTSYFENLSTLRSALNVLISDGDSDTTDEKAIIKALVGENKEDCYDNFEAMLTIGTYDTAANAWSSFAAENPEYGIFTSLGFDDGEELKADYEEFTTKIYNVITGSTNDLFEFFCEEYNLDKNYYVNFGDNVDAYKAQAIKTELDALHELYSDVDISALDSTEKSTVYTKLDSYLATLETYADQVMAAENIFANDLVKYYNLEAAFECEVNSAVAFFIKWATSDYSRISTNTLLTLFSGSSFESNYTSLDTLKEKLIETVGEEKTSELLDSIYAYADGLQAQIYDYLGSRFEGQVAYAMDYCDSLSDDVVIDAKLYLNLKASIGAIDKEIYDTFILNDGSDYNAYVDEQTQLDYALLLEEIIPAYEAVGATLGFDVYNQTDVEYEIRDYYEGVDVLKNENTDYIVDDEKLYEVISTIDKLLGDEEVLAVIFELLGVEGDSLDTLIYDLLESALFSDSVINAVVYMLYPLIQGEFSSIELPSITGLSYAYDTIDEALAQEYDGTNGLTVYPAGVGSLVSAYPEASAALKSAGLDWKHSSIYDPITGTLTLDWGLDEVMASIDDGTYTGSQTKLEVFIDTLGAALQGLHPLLKAMLADTDWRLYDSDFGSLILDVYLELQSTSVDGYVNVLGPIYELLGFYDYSTETQVSETTNSTELLTVIFDDIYALIAHIFETPVEIILDALPGIIYSLEFDMIPKLLSLINLNITYDAGVLGGTSVTSGSIDVDLGTMIDLEDMGLDTSAGFSGILGLFGISLSGLNTGILGTCGELTEVVSNRTQAIYDTSKMTGNNNAYKIVADTEGVLYYVLTYVIDSIKTGSLYSVIESIVAMFVSDEDEVQATVDSIEDIIVNELNFSQAYVSAGDVIAAVCELFAPYNYDQAQYFVLAAIETDDTYIDADGVEQELPDGYVWDEETQTLVGKFDHLYTDYWTIDQAEFVAKDLVNYATQIASIFDIDINEALSGLVGDLLTDVFTTSTIDSLLDLIDGLLDEYLTDETIAMIIEIVDDLGLVDDIDVDAIITAITEFEYTAFADGDRAAFMNVIVDYILPLKPVLDLFLVGESSISLYGKAIEVNGYNGYNAAIVPILEALGCDPEDITTYDVLVTLEDKAFIEAIVNPIMGLLDKVDSTDLFETVLDILPNILYFIKVGGLNEAIDNILHPVYAVLDTIRPIYNLSFTIDIDVVGLIDSMLADLDLGGYVTFSFDELVEAVLMLGETEVRQSVVDKADGTKYEYNYVVIAEQNQVHLVTILIQYISKSLTIMQNEYIQEVISVLGVLATFLDDKQYGELKSFLTGLAALEPGEQTAFAIYYIIYGLETGIGNLKDMVEDLLDYSGLTPDQQEELVEILASLILAINNFSLDDFTQSFNQIFEALQSAIEDAFGNIEDAVEGTTNAFVKFFEDLFAKIKAFFDNLFKF